MSEDNVVPNAAEEKMGKALSNEQGGNGADAHPRLGGRVALRRTRAIARTAGCEHASAISEDRNTPRFVERQPSRKVLDEQGRSHVFIV